MKNISLNKKEIIKTLVAFLLIFPFFPIQAINKGVVDEIYDIVLIASITISILIAIKNKYIIKEKNIIFLILYVITLVISCAYNKITIIPGLFYGGKILSFYLLNYHYIKNKDITLIKVEIAYLTFLITTNLFFQIIDKNMFGFYEISKNSKNFFASDNELGYYYIGYLSLLLIYDNIKDIKISKFTILMFIVCFVSTLICDSKKSIIGFLMIIIYMFFVYYKPINKYLSPTILGITYIVSYISIVIFNVHQKFTFIIEDILHKGSTVLSRIIIWKSAFEKIKKSPILGYGVIKGGRQKICESKAKFLVGSSNNLIEVTLETGIIGLIMYLGFVYSSIKININSLKEKEKKTYYMLVFYIFVLGIMFIFSVTIYNVGAYIPIILCANIKDIYNLERNK